VKLARLVGSILVFLASMAFIAGLSVFFVGGYLLTWPVSRNIASPRSARTKALMQLFVALMAVGSAYGLEEKLQPDSDE
jgi:Kef-type K+ transport system membrane component KefB